jgi:hypothetical protein
MSRKQQTAIEQASRLVAETYYGDKGRWICDAFEAINERYFAHFGAPDEYDSRARLPGQLN